MSDTPPPTPPGWYADPQNHGTERWWDGRAWTDNQRQRGSVENPPPPPPSATAASVPKKPVNRVARAALAVALVAFILGCIPFVGFVSWLLAAAAIVIAIVALTRTGVRKGAAVFGLLVGILALIVGPTVAITSVVNAAHHSTLAAGAATSAAPTAAAAPVTTAPPTSAAPVKTAAPKVSKPKVFTGTGDDVVKVNDSDAVVVAFSCSRCDSNTVLQTDSGTNTLLVNTIGAYSGRHLVNTDDGDLLTRLTVKADAKWKLTITKLQDAIHTRLDTVGHKVTGNGDDVIYIGGDIGDVKVVNHAGANAGNFVVQAYGDSVIDPLIVNQIGSYSGTEPLQGPAFVQIESDGKWGLTGED